MAFTKYTIILTIFCFFLIQELQINGGNQPIMVAAQGYDCGGKCNYRCSKSPPKDCLTNCLFCCNLYKCVPPGTSGNREACPDYAKHPDYLGKPLCP
ncbi:PREDICTED: peamaclein-like [Lupinus angustifolius]|uniref:peamaclein-like n=1 Tax=Lupinus angustifolius TaxID=3871 RepID=UPI00092F8C5A|nr:PREDICTED: peamaclein-like [Lupinus angustifolius]